jgi:hypothetical protein
MVSLDKLKQVVIFLNHSWLLVTEATERETADKQGLLYYFICEYN